MKRITILAAAGALVVTPAFGAWAAFAASDDNPAHGTAQVRIVHRHHGEAEPGDDHGRHGRHHGEPEPGDHRGRQGEPEPGDDHGDHDGDHHGDHHGRHHGEDND